MENESKVVLENSKKKNISKKKPKLATTAKIINPDEAVEMYGDLWIVSIGGID